MDSLTVLLVAGITATCLPKTAAGAQAASIYKEVYPPIDLNQNFSDSNHLFFSLVQSFGREFNASGNIAGIKVALDRINSDSSILPNHTLHYTLSDSQVSLAIIANTAVIARDLQLL